jgi:hypothetical protein
VTHHQKQWFAAAPWESVVTLNKALCQAQQMEPLTKAESLQAARQLWEKSISKVMTLKEAIEVCHRCQELGPFTFNNGNTFAALGRTLVEDFLRPMPPLEAQIIRTTICHYITGLVGRRELLQVLRHFEPWLDTSPEATAQPDSPPVLVAPPGTAGQQASA